MARRIQSIEHLSGERNAVSTKPRIIIEGKQRIELTETIISNNLLEEKIGLYEHIHMINTQASRFLAVDKNNTEYTSEVEYTKFIGLMITIMAKIFPGQFKKQSQKWMENFNVFVESNNLGL